VATLAEGVCPGEERRSADHFHAVAGEGQGKVPDGDRVLPRRRAGTRARGNALEDYREPEHGECNVERVHPGGPAGPATPVVMLKVLRLCGNAEAGQVEPEYTTVFRRR